MPFPDMDVIKGVLEPSPDALLLPFLMVRSYNAINPLWKFMVFFQRKKLLGIIYSTLLVGRIWIKVVIS
jgi:hypothetical protein